MSEQDGTPPPRDSVSPRRRSRRKSLSRTTSEHIKRIFDWSSPAQNVGNNLSSPLPDRAPLLPNKSIDILPPRLGANRILSNSLSQEAILDQLRSSKTCGYLFIHYSSLEFYQIARQGNLTKKKGKPNYFRFWAELSLNSTVIREKHIRFEVDCEDELPSILPDPEMGVFYIPENLNNLGSVDKSIGNYKNLDKQSKKNQLLGCISISKMRMYKIKEVELLLVDENNLKGRRHTFFANQQELEEWIATFELISLRATPQLYKEIGSVTEDKSSQQGFSTCKSITQIINYFSSEPPIFGAFVDYQRELFKPFFFENIKLKYSFIAKHFTEKLRLEKYFIEDFHHQIFPIWRISSGTFDDLMLWALITCEFKDFENIDFTAILMEFSSDDLLTSLKTIWDKIKEDVAKFREELVNIEKDINTEEDPNSLVPQRTTTEIEEDLFNFTLFKRKLGRMLKQWMKFLTLPNLTDASSTFPQRENLIQFAQENFDEIPCSLLVLHQTAPENPLIAPLSTYEPAPAISIFDISVAEMVEQITLKESELQSRIHYSELLKLRFQDDPEAGAPNIAIATDYFNSVGFWVATEILKEQDLAGQALATTRFVEIADHLFKLRNYSSCVQILSGINNIAVKRLKQMQAKLPPSIVETHERLTDTFDPISGYGAYRKLSFAFPCLPLIAVALRTIGLIEEGNSVFINETKTSYNFSRLIMRVEAILTLNLNCATNYSFTLNPSVRYWLDTVKGLSADELYEISLACEAPRNKQLEDAKEVKKEGGGNSFFRKKFKNKNPLRTNSLDLRKSVGDSQAKRRSHFFKNIDIKKSYSYTPEPESSNERKSEITMSFSTDSLHSSLPKEKEKLKKRKLKPGIRSQSMSVPSAVVKTLFSSEGVIDEENIAAILANTKDKVEPDIRLSTPKRDSKS